MSVSNYQFGKGSVVFAKSDSLPSYICGRPLLVVSDYIPIYGYLTCIEITSVPHPGIVVHLRNYSTGTSLGGYSVSYAKPYKMLSVPVESIVSCIGVVSRFVMKEVDKSIDFFLGRSDEIPEYLSDIDDYYKVEFCKSVGGRYVPNENCGSEYLKDYNAFIPHHNDMPAQIQLENETAQSKESEVFTIFNNLSIFTPGKKRQLITNWQKDKCCYSKIEDISKFDTFIIVSRLANVTNVSIKWACSRELAEKIIDKLTSFVIVTADADLQVLDKKNGASLLDSDPITLLGAYLVYRFDSEFFESRYSELYMQMKNISAALEQNFFTTDSRVWKRGAKWYEKNKGTLFDK